MSQYEELSRHIKEQDEVDLRKLESEAERLKRKEEQKRALLERDGDFVTVQQTGRSFVFRASAVVLAIDASQVLIRSDENGLETNEFEQQAWTELQLSTGRSLRLRAELSDVLELLLDAALPNTR